jgi:hypothetical protein
MVKPRLCIAQLVLCKYLWSGRRTSSGSSSSRHEAPNEGTSWVIMLVLLTLVRLMWVLKPLLALLMWVQLLC